MNLRVLTPGVMSVGLLLGWRVAEAVPTGDWVGTFQDTVKAGSALNNGTLDLQFLTETPQSLGS